jgi:NAD(P)H dehydrogenase (quinone)
VLTIEIMTVAVTGASGGVGSRVVRSLLDPENGVPVVALTRTPEAIPRLPHLTARYANYDEPSSLRPSFNGVDTLVFISSDDVAEPMQRHHADVVSAAVDAGVEHIVYMSIVDIAPDSGFYYSPVHRETEAMLADSGIGYALARTSIFADFFVSTWVAPSLCDGALALPTASGRMSLVTRDDVARSLAALAVERMPVIVELTGPAALTAEEICEITQRSTGRELRFRALDEPSYRALMARDSAPDWLIAAYTTMFGSVREGRFETVSADIPDLIGAPQESYAGFLKRLAEPPG